MTDIAKLILDADTKGLKRGERDLDRLGKQSRTTARNVDGSAAQISGAFKKVAAAAVAAGLTTVLYEFGKASTQAAIDAEEMNSAFDVVFGEMSEGVRDWAEETGNALGRSTQEVQRGALAFQELFGKSLQPEKAAELSKEFAVLTQDLASFKNLSNEVAQQKLFSGLVGEAEPLRAVGVFLSETALKAKALELGLGGVNGALTDQEKIVVRAAIIQEQLADAQGDVIRTSDSAANQIKTMNAAVEELQVAVGQKLLPKLTPLVAVSAELINELIGVAEAIDVTTRNTADLVAGVRVAIQAFKDITAGASAAARSIGITSERVRFLYESVTNTLTPLSGLLDLLEQIGAEQRRIEADQQFFNDVGLGSGQFKSLKDIIRDSGLASTAMEGAGKSAVSLSRSIGRASQSAREAADPFADLMEALYPENITRRQIEQLAMIEKYADRIDDVYEARRRALGLPAANDNPVSDGLLNQGPLKEAEQVKVAASDIADAFEDQVKRMGEQGVIIKRTFREISQDVTRSLQGLASSIQSGNFFDILSSVVDLLAQLGSVGLFGSSIAKSLNSAPAFGGARAEGGPVSAGKTYLVGERGPELFTPPSSGYVHSNDNLGGGKIDVTVTMDESTGRLGAFVRNQAGAVVAEAAPTIIRAGGQAGVAQMGKISSRRLG